MHHAVITLEQLRKVYPGRGARDDVVALAGIDLHVERGTVHGIVGESGAGKSTLVRCLTALEQPTSGRVVLDGQDLTGLGERALRRQRRNIGMVHQHVNLFDARTAAANIAYPLGIAKTPRAQQTARVAELLDLVGLAGRGDSYPAQLSGGQKQRVGIARALAADPRVLLCDEPTSALDSQTTAQILDLIRDVRDRLGVTVVIITHEMDVVRRACDTVTLLDQGRVAQSGTLEDVVSDVGSRLSRALVPLPPVPEVPAGNRVLDVFFTSHPGRPDAARVMEVVARLGADIAAGTMETLGTVQVGRFALTVAADRVGEVLTALQGAGAFAEVRA